MGWEWDVDGMERGWNGAGMMSGVLRELERAVAVMTSDGCVWDLGVRSLRIIRGSGSSWHGQSPGLLLAPSASGDEIFKLIAFC